MKNVQTQPEELDAILKKLGAIAEEEIDKSFENFDKEALLFLAEIEERQKA
jgi:hypothetical protein